MQGKIALITGASRGIGAAVAKRYAKEGAHVILLARTVSALEEVDDTIQKEGGKATLVPLDLNDFTKIDELGSIIANKFGKIDVLVGNAARLGVLSPTAHIDPESWEKTFKLNVTANYRLIRSFDSLLKQSDNGRVIFVSSSSANSNTPFWGLYASTKAALDKLAQTYASEVEKTNLRVNIVDPGIIATKMLEEAMPGQDISNFKKPEQITDIFVKLASNTMNDNGKIFKAEG